MIRKLSLDGYQSFKISLTRETTSVKDIVESENNPLDDYVDEIINTLGKLRNTLNEENVDIAVEKILEARRIVFFGVGLSAVPAHYGSLLLSLLGFPAFSYSDPHTQVIVATGLTDEDLVISVSHSGNIRDIVKSTQVAKDVGATTICITAGIDSPITKVADLVLYSPVTKFEHHEFLRGNLGELAVVEIIFRTLLSKVYESKLEHFDEVSKVLKPKKYDESK